MRSFKIGLIAVMLLLAAAILSKGPGLLLETAPLSGSVLAQSPGESWQVDTTIDSLDAVPSDGRCADLAGRCSLRAAVQEANAGQGPAEIRLPAGQYRLTLAGTDDRANSGDLDVLAQITIIGLGGRNATHIVSDVDDRLIHVMPGAALRMESLSLSGGRAVDRGGAVFNDGGQLTIVDGILKGNRTETDGSGGGVFSRDGTLRIERSVLRDNASGVGPYAFGDGGALAIVERRRFALQAVLEDVVFEDNVGGDGGAIHLDGPRLRDAAALTLIRCGLHGNEAMQTSGGAIDSAWFSIEIQDSSLQDNQAREKGSAIYHLNGRLRLQDTVVGYHGDAAGVIRFESSNVEIERSAIVENGDGILAGIWQPSSLRVTNSTISRNGNDDRANAIRAGGSTAVTLTHVTIAYNGAPGSGQIAIGLDRDASHPQLWLSNSILAHAHAEDGRNCDAERLSSVISLGGNLDTDGSCLGGREAADDILSVDPQLGPLADNGGFTFTHALGASSPAIDAADAHRCPAVDQRGAPRAIGVGCDIGALEQGSQVPDGPLPAPGASLAPLHLPAIFVLHESG